MYQGTLVLWKDWPPFNNSAARYGISILIEVAPDRNLVPSHFAAKNRERNRKIERGWYKDLLQTPSRSRQKSIGIGLNSSRCESYLSSSPRYARFS